MYEHMSEEEQWRRSAYKEEVRRQYEGLRNFDSADLDPHRMGYHDEVPRHTMEPCEVTPVIEEDPVQAELKRRIGDRPQGMDIRMWATMNRRERREFLRGKR